MKVICVLVPPIKSYHKHTEGDFTKNTARELPLQAKTDC